MDGKGWGNPITESTDPSRSTRCKDGRSSFWIGGHRAVVRQRCAEIQRQSGFSDRLSGQAVLERLWCEDDEWSDGDLPARPRQNGPLSTVEHSFRWRRAMDRIDGEYIVIGRAEPRAAISRRVAHHPA